MAENKERIIEIYVDTVTGPEVVKVDLSKVPLPELADMASQIPELRDYYGERLIQDDSIESN
jgi:hypothetical protein